MRLITCILCNEKKVFNTQNAPVLNGVKITISHLPCKHLVRDADPISSLGEVLMMELDWAFDVYIIYHIHIFIMHHC